MKNCCKIEKPKVKRGKRKKSDTRKEKKTGEQKNEAEVTTFKS